MPALCNPMSASQCSPQCSQTQKTPSGWGSAGAASRRQLSSSHRAAAVPAASSRCAPPFRPLPRIVLHELSPVRKGTTPRTHAPIAPTEQQLRESRPRLPCPLLARLSLAAHSLLSHHPACCRPTRRGRLALATQEGGHAGGTETAAEDVAAPAWTEVRRCPILVP